jgi:hypothetical protein
MRAVRSRMRTARYPHRVVAGRNAVVLPSDRLDESSRRPKEAEKLDLTQASSWLKPSKAAVRAPYV